MFSIGITAILLSVLFYVIYYSTVKEFSKDTNYRVTAIVVVGISIVPMIAAAAFFGMPYSGMLWLPLSVAAGVFLFLGFELLYIALHTQHLTSAVGVGEIQTVILALFGIFVFGETVRTASIIGMVVVFTGIALMLAGKRAKMNRKLLPFLASSVCLSAFWIVTSYSMQSASGFLAPLIVSRAVALAFTAVAFFLAPGAIGNKTKASERGIRRKALVVILLGAAAGIADGIGDSLFSFAVSHGYLAVGAVLTMLIPVAVATIAYFAYRERLMSIELAGFVLILAGALIMLA
jgi:drug/metabolite transporter (DMT)-like permease